MPRGTQVPAWSFSVSHTGLSPSMVRLSSQLLLPNPESIMPALQPRLNVSNRFGLYPLRSPLLRVSRLISFPAGTEMFHFPALAPAHLCIQCAVTEHYFRRVSPFRYPRIKGCLAPPRGFSQPATSFIAFQRQGIHLVPLVTYYSSKYHHHQLTPVVTLLPLPYSIVKEYGPLRPRSSHSALKRQGDLRLPSAAKWVFTPGQGRCQ